MTRDEAWEILLKKGDGEEVSAEDLALALDSYYTAEMFPTEHLLLSEYRKQGRKDAQIAIEFMLI